MKNKLILLALALLAILSASCRNTESTSIEREDRFSLEIGPMEDQIALYRLEGNRGIRNVSFTMRDGLFYIVDGNSAKVTHFNSYGDILFMIFNEHTNPAPITLRTNISEDEHATRWAYTYPLEEPGWIAVNSRRHIFVEDRLPREDQRTDPETRSLLDGIILQFDHNGRFVNYLGREGIGGSPFPRIVGLSTTVRDEIVVSCILLDGWEVYWFNSAGTLLYLVKISNTTIPALADWPEAMSFIDNISVSPDSRHLYIKANYSSDTFDPSTQSRTGTLPISSVIWTLNVEDGSYASSVEIPLFEKIENGRPVKLFYSVLGAARNGKLILYATIDQGFSLLYVNTVSREQRRGFIEFSIDESQYNDFIVSPEGIISAMLADNFNVKMVWWRTDKFIGEAL